MTGRIPVTFQVTGEPLVDLSDVSKGFDLGRQNCGSHYLRKFPPISQSYAFEVHTLRSLSLVPFWDCAGSSRSVEQSGAELTMAVDLEME